MEALSNIELVVLKDIVRQCMAERVLNNFFPAEEAAARFIADYYEYDIGDTKGRIFLTKLRRQGVSDPNDGRDVFEYFRRKQEEKHKP